MVMQIVIDKNGNLHDYWGDGNIGHMPALPHFSLPYSWKIIR